jgi:hypothetical protein
MEELSECGEKAVTVGEKLSRDFRVAQLFRSELVRVPPFQNERRSGASIDFL